MATKKNTKKTTLKTKTTSKKVSNKSMANDVFTSIIGKNRCYIIRDDNNKKHVFQFNPSSLPYSRGAKYTSIESPCMSYPLTQYAGGKAREFSFEVFYYDRPFTGRINKARKFLEGLLPPEKNTKKFKRPPSFTFAYGYFVRKYVLTNLEVKDEMLNSDGQPVITRFTLSVRQVGK